MHVPLKNAYQMQFSKTSKSNEYEMWVSVTT